MKNLVKFIIGVVVLSLGITIMSITNLGIGPWDSLNFGLSKLINISISLALIITSTMVLVISSLIRKERPKISTFITAIFIGLVLDFWKVIFNEMTIEINYLKYVVFTLGLFISSFGIAVYLTSKFPQNPIDYLTITIQEKFKIRISLAKLIIDSICIILAIAVRGPIGIGTLIATICTGPIVGLICSIII